MGVLGVSADDAVGGGDSPQDPNEIALEALETAVDTIESVEPSDTIAYAQAQDDAVNEFAATIAEAANAGLPESRWAQYCGSLASESRLLNKTDIKKTVESEIAAKGERSAGTYPGLLGYLEDHVTEIDAVRSTDAKQSTIYRWKFDDPDFGRFQIESGTDSETTHFKWWELRSAIFDVSGIWTAEPPEEIKEDWNDIIGPFIQEHSEEVVHKGPRTCAVESLQNYVHRTEAFPTIEDMVDFHGTRIDDDPEEGDPSEIWVTNTEVSKICEDHAISERALQVELEARGYTVGRVGGVSETTFVHGDKFTYWVLDADFADPREYVTDPESATERLESMLEEQADEADEDDELEPGVIGSTDADDKGWVVFDESADEVVKGGFGTEAEALGWAAKYDHDGEQFTVAEASEVSGDE